jgi:hypothetical protein
MALAPPPELTEHRELLADLAADISLDYAGRLEEGAMRNWLIDLALSLLEPDDDELAELIDGCRHQAYDSEPATE